MLKALYVPSMLSNSAKLAELSKPNCLLKSLQATHQKTLRLLTFDKGDSHDVKKCMTALGKQAGTTQMSTHIMCLDDGTKVQIGINFSPHMAYFHFAWMGVGKAKVSESMSGETRYFTSSHVAWFFMTTPDTASLIQGSKSTCSHDLLRAVGP